ncbi:DUF421 domain-containing protein [Terrilactibacillus sp. BCM23-1]|uniref:DUF421 domain-containing protein n=1 Tax=Terrilactibacillus tamarindi TaxID=2599694 RepID=A0A6N8CRH9_9BACI|nr:DUF421 domain-containing protein [Terrilactibacillus tamarindi]MTT32849.1 DUF421 domain-containing protein [Terrilactibacillus tamarindi]
MDRILTTSIRTLIGFVLLLILTRILGKKQLSQMTIFTYITGIALGNIAGDMVVHRDIKIIDGFTGMTLWALLTLLIEYISLKSSKARVLLNDEPTIIIKKGKIMKKAMVAEKLNLDDLTMLLRNNNVFSMADVDYAILEPNGELSVLKKEEKELLTKKDANVQIHYSRYIPTELIVDGKIVEKNLKEEHIQKEWLIDQLKMNGIHSIHEVNYAELQMDGSLFVDKN